VIFEGAGATPHPSVTSRKPVIMPWQIFRSSAVRRGSLDGSPAGPGAINNPMVVGEPGSRRRGVGVLDPVAMAWLRGDGLRPFSKT
jgi:hypothetical protein